MFYNTVRLILVIMLPIVFSFRSSTNPPTENGKKPVKWIVEKSSTLKVTGKSNVNQFSCDINGYYQSDTFYCEEKSACDKTIRLKGALEIDVLEFDCHNRIVTSDLRKTLKAKDHPKLHIRFLSLDRMPAFTNKCENVRGTVEIQLAGECKVFEICYQFINQGKAPIEMIGVKNFSFSDFHLSPPKKLAGMIKVSDEFQVGFHLRLLTLN